MQNRLERDRLFDIVRQRIAPHYAKLAELRSSRELERSQEYAGIAADVRIVLDSILRGDCQTAEFPARDSYRCVAWNIERGVKLEEQINALRTDPYLKESDVLFLTEVDAGMARSRNLDVAFEFANQLGYRYAFAPCYLNLGKGTGLERRAPGENALGLHGNAVLSRYSIGSARSMALPNAVDKMAGREKRIGAERALIAEIEFPQGPVTVVCQHLDVLASQAHRARQMRLILDAVESAPRVILGGDWNTNTYNGSHAWFVFLGFLRRVVMGADYVIRTHSMHPEREFEKRMFDLLESRGYDFRSANCLGEYTASYDISDPAHYTSLAEWLPSSAFALVRWALRRHNGRCPMKLDWFAARGVRAQNPRVLHEPRHTGREPMSDHDAIGVEFRF